MKIKILSTLGPSSLNKDFLKFCKNKVYLLRINLSHIEIKNLSKIIKFIRKNTKIKICIDTEGAQIRTKLKKNFFLKKNQISKIYRNKSKFNLYPNIVYDQIKKDDILDIGFRGLKLQVVKISKDFIKIKAISPGLVENNKGVHIVNRLIKLNYLTNKDFAAIKIAKKMKIKNFSLSFTNSKNDIVKFEKLLPKARKIYKIETKSAVKNIDQMLKKGNEFLIDRFDLSKSVKLESIPLIQKTIITKAKKEHCKVYVATNFLESMVNNLIPTAGEANDIYSSLDVGASGLVLAAETAIGKYPKECLKFLVKQIDVFLKNKKYKHA